MGGVLSDVLTIIEGDEGGVLPFLCQLFQQSVQLGVGAEQLALLQGQIVALMDLKAVEVGVPGGIGNLRGGDGGQRFSHGLRNRCDLCLRVHAHHGGDALRNSLAGDDHHVFLRQALTLLSGHDDVAVIGQNKHGLSGDLIDPGQNTLRGGVHGLTAGDYGIAAQVPEHGGKAVAGADGQEAYGLFGGGYLVTAFPVFQFFLNGVQIVGALGGLAGGIAKFVAPVEAELGKIIDLKPGTLVLAAAGQYATKSVGVLIKTFGAACENHFDKERYEFCWIVDFPMYEIGDESGELEFCHNPFSMPNGGMDILLKAERGEIDPLDIYANQYDLVCNGVELSSGAVRNHDPEIMIKAFELVRLGEEDVKKKFPAMYNAFCYGAPPHAGIAPGVDRMVMLLAGESSIREIIPFPMNKNAQDVMMSAPSVVEQKQLDELHIAIVGDVEKDD